MAQETLDWQIRLSADESAARRAVQTIDAVDTAGRKVKTTLGEYGPVAKAAMRSVDGGFDMLDRSFREHRALIEDVRDAYLEEAEAAEMAARAAQQAAQAGPGGSAQDRFDDVSKQVALAGDFQSNLGALRGLADVAGAGGVGQGVGVAGEVIALLEELPRLKEAAAGLPSVVNAAAGALGTSTTGLIGTLGAAGIAVAAIAVASQIALQRAEEARKFAERVAQEQLSAQDAYFQAIIGGMTSDEARAQIAEIERQNEILIIQRAELAYSIEQNRAAGNDITKLQERYDELASSISESEVLVGRYERGIRVGSFAANDAAANAELLEDALTNLGDTFGYVIDKAEQLAAEQIRAQVDVFKSQADQELRAQRMTAEQRANAIADIELEIANLQRLGAEREGNAAIQSYVAERTQQLSAQMQILSATTETAADAEAELSRARTVIQENYDALFDATSKVAEAEGKLIDARKAADKAAAESEAALEKIRSDLRDKEAEINAKADEALTKAVEKAEAQRTKIAADAAKERLKNEETFTKSSKAAMAARDEAAYDQAVEAYEEEKKRINDSEKERLDELEASLEEQRNTILAAQRQQQQDAQDNARRLIDTERNRYAQQRIDLQNATNQARVDLINAENAQRMIKATYYAQEAAAANQQYANLIYAAYTAGESMVDAFEAGIQTALLMAGAGGGEFIPPAIGIGGARAGGFGSGTLQNNIYLNGVLTRQEAVSIVNDGFDEFNRTYMNLRRRTA